MIRNEKKLNVSMKIMEISLILDYIEDAYTYSMKIEYIVDLFKKINSYPELLQFENLRNSILKRTIYLNDKIDKHKLIENKLKNELLKEINQTHNFIKNYNNN